MLYTVLLYTGILVQKDCVSSDQYYHFLLLHSTIRLSSSKSHLIVADISQKILDDFVNYFGLLYGDQLVSFNVHELLHLTVCQTI